MKQSRIEITREYLNELKEARMKYGLSDFPKYLNECIEIDKKYGYVSNNTPNDELSKSIKALQ